MPRVLGKNKEMDQLERNIKAAREELDQIESLDTERVWKGIQEELNPTTKVRRLSNKRWWAIAAAVAILILSVNTFLMWQKINQVDETLEYSLSSLSPELAAKEATYKKLIHAKAEVIATAALSEATFKAFFEELALLDTLQKEYTEQIPLYGANERLINTLIRYYELKIRLLERLENELIKKRHHEIREQNSSI